MVGVDYCFQEKNKEKKVVPGKKEEETKRKKLTVVDSQVNIEFITWILSPLIILYNEEHILYFG